MNAVVEAVRPVDGTQDAEADRNAIKDALSQLLDQFPNADMLDLDEDQRSFVVERFVAVDIFNRICLDIAKAVQDKARSTQTVGLSHTPRDQRITSARRYRLVSPPLRARLDWRDAHGAAHVRDRQPDDSRDLSSVRRFHLMKILCAPLDLGFKIGTRADLDVVLYGHPDKPSRGSAGANILEAMRRLQLKPAARAWDILSIALAVTAADTAVRRDQSPDGWTREIDLQVAVGDSAFWSSQTLSR